MSVNDITNNRLTTGAVSEDYRSGYDAIWGKAEKPKQPLSYESEYLARSRSVIAEWWDDMPLMWKLLDELSKEYGK